MSNYKHILRKCFLLAAVLCLFVTAAVTASAAKFGERYDADAAVSYAVAHWDDGVGVCDQFVKACLKAGGVEILAGDVDPVKDALVDAGLGKLCNMKISADGVHALETENPGIQAGDVLFLYCEKCGRSVHTAIIGGYDKNGYLYTYAHNPGWNKVNWLGNFTHKGDDGKSHKNCWQYIVVAMDRDEYSHIHNFDKEEYEAGHPHEIYVKCSCKAKYYLGWNATVSTCTTCNPPVSDVPVVTVKTDGKTFNLSWSTVYGAVKYEVYRSTSKTGEYFKLFSDMSTTLVNKSATKGNTYFFRVDAVLKTDSKGNPKKSVSSKIIACTLEDGVVFVPDAPVLTVKLNSSNKVALSWKAVSGAKKYEIYHAPGKYDEYKKIKTVTGKSYTYLPDAGKNYYKIVAVASNGQKSEFSELKSVSVPFSVKPKATGKADSKNNAVVSWKTVPGAWQYEVYYSTSKNGKYTCLESTDGLKFKRESNPGTYYYKVRAVSADGQKSAFSSIVSVSVPFRTKPVVKGKVVDTMAYMDWDMVSGAVKYEIYRATSKDGKYTKLKITENSSYKYDAGAGTYYYKIRAVASDGQVSSFSKIVKISVPFRYKPVIAVKVNSSKKPVVSWKTVPGAVKYEVYRATSQNGKYTKLGTTTKLKYTDNPGAGRFYYKVRAVASDGQTSKFSVIINAFVPFPDGVKPAIKAKTSSKKAVISWKAVPGAVKYEVYRATSKNGKYTCLTSTDKLTYANSVKAGTYYYKVRAVTTGNKSEYSNILSVKVPK